MAFDPATFVDLADTLRTQSTGDDAALRACISRAYYGAFLSARNRYGLSSVGQDGHKNVIKHYQDNPRNPACKGVADALLTLKKLRVTADYFTASTCTARDGEKAIEMAKRALKLLVSTPQPNT